MQGARVKHCLPGAAATASYRFACERRPHIYPVNKGAHKMATREHRIAEFNAGPPPDGEAVEVLCEDHNGTYLLPFACRFINNKWFNAFINQEIEGTVLGWRAFTR